MPRIEKSDMQNRSTGIMRQSAVDLEQNKPFIDHESHVYNIRQKYLCRTCFGILYTGVFTFLGFYLGYTTKVCDDNDSSSYS